jgi:hypothetical protein
MLSLLNAIYSYFTGNGALVATFPGGFYRDQVPQATAMPYVVSHVVQSKLEYAYGGPSRSDTQVRFHVYGIGHDATGALMDVLVGQFDDHLLALSSGTNDTVTRLGEPLPALHKHDGQGNDVWEWSVTYEYGVKP